MSRYNNSNNHHTNNNNSNSNSNSNSTPHTGSQHHPNHHHNHTQQHQGHANGPRLISRDNARILCVADIRGLLSSLNQLAQQYEATHILHTGDFGFYDHSSLERMTDKTLRHVIQYSPLVSPSSRSNTFSTHPNNDIANLRRAVQGSEKNVISELQEFLDGKKQLQVPVYTVWGACEDVSVLEKFRSQEYKIANLNIVDEAASKLLTVGGLNIRLFGLGGAVVLHKLFDNGDGKSTIAGAQGTMWTTVLQIGELLHTADRTFSSTETRILMTHHSPGREGLLSQLAHTLKADFTISAGLHFRYGSSYNDFSVSPSPTHYSQKLALSRSSFMAIYDVVKPDLQSLLNPSQSQLLNSVLAMVEAMPKDNADSTNMDSSFKNTWNFNLPDAQFGSLVLDIKDGRVSEEIRSQGFNFAYRRGGDSRVDREKQRTVSQAQIAPATKSQTSSAPQKAETPTPAPVQAPTPVPAPTASAPVKAEKATMPPAPKAVKNQKPVAAQAQQVAADTPLPEPTATEAAPASNSGSEPATPQQPGLWVSPCPTTERAKALFPASTSANLKTTPAGRQYAYVFFSTTEDMSAGLAAWEAKEDKDGVLVKEMQTQTGNRQANRGGRGGRGANRGTFRGRGRGRGGPAGTTSAAPASSAE